MMFVRAHPEHTQMGKVSDTIKQTQEALFGNVLLENPLNLVTFYKTVKKELNWPYEIPLKFKSGLFSLD